MLWPPSSTSLPAGFTVHPKLARQLHQRAELYAAGEVEWALGEALAFGSVLTDGYDVRLAGQDTRRGTFSQRHSVLFDYETGAEYVPLASALATPGHDESDRRPGRFMVYDSLLSEYAVLGFEYGYSVESSEALVAWEAQFGDFANGAQIVIDNFLSSAGDKWGQNSALTLLLPHGYEGQGPEHSSARLERFLSLCADGNMTVAQPTTAAQYFHLLRAQALRSTRRPLIVMTPKSLLRARQARSSIEQLVAGSWNEVLDDEGVDRAAVERVVLCSGKVAYEAMTRRDRIVDAAGAPIAVTRVEQLYPWPERQISEMLERLPRRSGGHLASGGAGEHGRLDVRPRPPAQAARGEVQAAARESRPVREPGDRLQRHPPAGDTRIFSPARSALFRAEPSPFGDHGRRSRSPIGSSA